MVFFEKSLPMKRSSFLKLEKQTNEGNTKWQDHYTEKARKLMTLGVSDEILAIALDVNVGTIRKWRNEYPEFGETIMKEKTKTNALVSFALFKTAIGYDTEEVKTIKDEEKGTVRIETTKKHVPGNYWAQKYWLETRERELWGSDKNGGPVMATQININNLNQFNLDSLSNEELKIALKLGIQQRQLGTTE